MLAGSLLFYGANNEIVYEVDLDDIELSSYRISNLFFELIEKYKVTKAVSQIYYHNGLPKEEVIYTKIKDEI